MNVAIPHWQGRVSPVFDVAANVLVVALDEGAECQRRDVAFDVEDALHRAAMLGETGANVLVCGAISRPLEQAVHARGIEVIPLICGDVERVLTAFVEGRLNHEAFLMPGCCRRRGGQGRNRGGCRSGGSGAGGWKGGDGDATR